MYFNKILSMPITSVSRCRVATSSTSFMAATFFEPSGEPKDAIAVDDIAFYISNRYDRTKGKLYYNEARDLFIIKYVTTQFPLDAKMYYLIFPPEILQETLTLICAKSTLRNQISNIKKAEYAECKMENGYILFDQFESFMKTDTITKLGNFSENVDMSMSGYVKNDDGLYEKKGADILKTSYFTCVNNVIVNRKLFDYDFIYNFLGYADLDDLSEDVDSSDYIVDETALYGINVARKTISVLFAAGEKFGVAFGSIEGNITPTSNLRNTNVSINMDKTLVINKALFAPNALEEITEALTNMYAEYKSSYGCTKSFAEAIRTFSENDIFMLFNM